MTISEAYIEYLKAPRANAAAMATALRSAGHEQEATCLVAWAADESVVLGDREVTLAAKMPIEIVPGGFWFDVAELTLSVQTGRAWISTRPTPRWKMRAFLALAPIEKREVQVVPPYRALDPERLLAGPENGRVTNVSHGEALLYSWWFGKSLASLLSWQEALENLPSDLVATLWEGSTKEWVSYAVDRDEGARVFATPSTLTLDPDEIAEEEAERPEKEHRMIRGEWTHEPDIGFRTSVLQQLGLFADVSSFRILAENVGFSSVLDRAPFV